MVGGRDESNIFFNNNDDDDGVIVREWMGPVAPTLANLPIFQFINLQILQQSFTNLAKNIVIFPADPESSAGA